MKEGYDYLIRAWRVSPSFLEQYREVFHFLKFLPPREYRHESRYKKVRTIMDEDTKKIYHETVNQNIVPEYADDIFITIDTTIEGRLDILSQVYYSTPVYWWVIAEANYIMDPFDVPYGTTIRIPKMIHCYDRGGRLSG